MGISCDSDSESDCLYSGEFTYERKGSRTWMQSLRRLSMIAASMGCDSERLLSMWYFDAVALLVNSLSLKWGDS